MEAEEASETVAQTTLIPCNDLNTVTLIRNQMLLSSTAKRIR
jgi:hypothetical protein